MSWSGGTRFQGFGAFSSRRFGAPGRAVWQRPKEVIHIPQEADEIVIVDARCLHLDDERGFFCWSHLFNGLGESHGVFLAERDGLAT